jgi:hypothetical protein
MSSLLILVYLLPAISSDRWICEGTRCGQTTRDRIMNNYCTHELKTSEIVREMTSNEKKNSKNSSNVMLLEMQRYKYWTNASYEE